MSDILLPKSFYYVYFTKDNLKNINPCRFNSYNDAYEYARRYNKSLLYAKIIKYAPSEMNGKDKQSQIIFDKLMRKIMLNNNKILYTYTYDNIENGIKICAELLLYRNIKITINLESHINDSIHIEDFERNILQNDLIAPYYELENRNIIRFKQKHISEENRYWCTSKAERYYTDLLEESKARLINCFGAIRITTYKENNIKIKNSIAYYCANDYNIFNYCKKIIKFIRKLPYESDLSNNTRICFANVINNTYDLPVYKNGNNYNKDITAIEFIDDFLK